MNASLLIATPMYGGMCNGSYATSLMQVPMALANTGIGMSYLHLMNESLITRARNLCADEFLRMDCTHLLFIDADIGFDPRVIPGMIARDVDILCGLYPKKEINWPRVSKAVMDGVPPAGLSEYVGSVVVNLVDDAKSKFVANGDLMQIANGGTGFMLIKREVFLKLSKKVPSYLNDMYHATVQNPEPQYIKEFFATSIDKESGRLLSEDYHFCKLARKHGFKVWADPMIDLTHTGTYIFSGATEKVAEGQPVKKTAKKPVAKKTNVKPRKTTQAKSR